MSKTKSITSECILAAMHDYEIVIRQIEKIRAELDEAHAGTAQYGLQASMPKATSKSDVLFSEYLRRERMHKTLDRMKEKVTIIQMFCDDVAYDRLSFKDKLILEYTLIGMTQKEISEKTEIGLTRTSVSRRQMHIAKKIFEQHKEMDHLNKGVAK